MDPSSNAFARQPEDYEKQFGPVRAYDFKGYFARKDYGRTGDAAGIQGAYGGPSGRDINAGWPEKLKPFDAAVKTYSDGGPAPQYGMPGPKGAQLITGIPSGMILGHGAAEMANLGPLVGKVAQTAGGVAGAIPFFSQASDAYDNMPGVTPSRFSPLNANSIGEYMHNNSNREARDGVINSVLAARMGTSAAVAAPALAIPGANLIDAGVIGMLGTGAGLTGMAAKQNFQNQVKFKDAADAWDRHTGNGPTQFRQYDQAHPANELNAFKD